MRRTRWTKTHSLGALAAVSLGALLIGCEDSTAPPSEQPVIKLGLFTRGDSGFNDDANVSLVLLALRQINEAGGLMLDGTDYLLDLETSNGLTI